MSARATRGPTEDAGTGDLKTTFSGAFGLAGFPTCFIVDARGLGDSCFTNHKRSVSSETCVPIWPKEATKMRTDVPSARSLRRTRRCISNASALVVLPALAWAINRESFWESLAVGSSIIGKSLGKSWANDGDRQGKHQRPAGEKSKQKSLDVGVSLKWMGVVC
jgi:hypothetical protein